MNLLEQFVDFLQSQKNKPSFFTIKNYKADINQFIIWFEKEFNLPFDPLKISIQTLTQYKKSRNLSPSSIDRHISSLRKFFSFLNLENIISHNPLQKEIASADKQALEDPLKLRSFKNFLYEYKKSNLTIKNYISDMKNFFLWLKEVSLTKYAWDVTERDLLSKINSYIVNEYKQRLITSKFSSKTINRKLSSLRSYINWAKNQGFVPSDQVSMSSRTSFGISRNGDEILNQVLPRRQAGQNDNEATYSSFPPLRLMQKSLKGTNFLFDNFFIVPIAKTIENGQYFFWQASGRKIFTKNVILNEVKDPMGFFAKAQNDKILNIKKEFFAPLNVSTRYLPRHQRVWHYLRHVRPNWYKEYHSYSISHYLHLAILLIFSCAVGFGIYNGLFPQEQKQKEILGAVANSAPRILSFQGKLTNSENNPINKSTTVLFSIYNHETASGTPLWKETNLVEPDPDGIFSILLGENNPIPEILFAQNQRLFLGITVGNTAELKPRQELATVAFASNAQVLQGLEPITKTNKTSNVLLAFDSGGNLSISDSKTHTFRAIGGNLVLSGSVLSLTTTAGSNSNVEIVPDGFGKIDFAKPIYNSTSNNNLSGAAGAAGAVEFDDLVAILATSSGQSAFTINQNSTGPLISASSSEIVKFTLANDGTGTFAGDALINGGDLISNAQTFNLFNSTVTKLNIGGAATEINLGVLGGTMNIESNLIVKKDFSLSSLTSNGGILYTNESGKIFQASAGSSSDCLKGGSTPFFSNCASIFSEANGAAYIGNTKLDVLFGGNSTSSAKFAFINLNSGTPTASISGNVIVSGNIGLGTLNPQAKLDIVGGQTQIEVSTQYSQRLCHNGLDGSSTQSVLLGDCSSGGADIAEYYGSKDATIEAGDIVVADGGATTVGSNSKAYINKSNSSYQGAIIGIVSTNPHESFGRNFDSSEYSFPVALVGRIPVKISLENGPIKAGDLLTSSSIPGVAMKATRTGSIVGKSLEDLNSIDQSKVVGFYDPDSKEYRSKANFPDITIKQNIVQIVKIYAFVNVSWYDPGSYLTQTGELVIHDTGSSGYSISNPFNEDLSNIGGFFEVVAANIRVGLINAQEIVTNTLIVTSDSLIVNGQNLRDYIVNVVEDSGITEPEIISPVVSTNQLFANVISPLSSSSLIVKLTTPSGSLIVENASGSAVAQIDDQGNASFSGTLISKNLEISDDADINGTLRAGNIIADSIEGFINIASFSGKLTYVPNLQTEQALFSDLSVVERLSIGESMFITQNSIETLATDLSLQSLRLGGLSIMGGLVYVDTNGNLTTKGDVAILGKLAVNIISPLPGSNLVIQNGKGSGVLSVSEKGDLVASGSGTFAKLNFNFVQPALAISATELIASSSAGTAKISPYQTEVTIRNALLTEKSVIYITPVGTPSAQSPFLMRQLPNGPALSEAEGSFTVGVYSPTLNPIPFNWLIIN